MRKLLRTVWKAEVTAAMSEQAMAVRRRGGGAVADV